MRFGQASGTADLVAVLAATTLRGALARLTLANLPLMALRPRPAAGGLLAGIEDRRRYDPALATDIYAGRLDLAGLVVHAGGRSPFDVRPPSQAWAEALHGFTWLGHLGAAGRPLALANARALVRDWLRPAKRRRGGAIACAPHVTACRLLSWLAAAPILLEGADPAFQRLFLRGLGAEARVLRRAAPGMENGASRLVAVAALAQACLCLADQERLRPRTERWLEEELKRQILPDGGHVSRHPGVLPDLLAELLPLRQTYAARHLAPPAGLVAAIDRMMPMLRLFQIGGGSLAHFNGMGPTPVLDAVLAYEDARSGPVRNATHSGYQRLDAGATTLVVDAGRAPPTRESGAAHAGCLSFELASGLSRIVVNCGNPAFAGGEWRAAARATAAHSTLGLADRSSCRFLSAGALARVLGTPVLGGPSRVEVARRDVEEGQVLDLSHDGYHPDFGLVHRRSLALSQDGSVLEGEDLLVGAPRSDAPYAVRFHLHPSVGVEGEGMTRRLTLENGERWVFVGSVEPAVEESVFLADLTGPRRTLQLVLHGRLSQSPGMRWILARES